MRNGRHLAWLAVLVCAVAWPQARVPPPLRNGDVVLQSEDAPFSRAIEYATRSPYSHVGVVEVAPDGIYVVEAIGHVSRTPWRKWAKRTKGRFTLLRAKSLTGPELARVVATAKQELGKPYDARFEWGDERLYCSELVYKAFQRGAGQPVGKLEPVRFLRLTGLEPLIRKRLGRPIPYDQKLVTPASIAADPKLAMVWSSL